MTEPTRTGSQSNEAGFLKAEDELLRVMAGDSPTDAVERGCQCGMIEHSDACLELQAEAYYRRKRQALATSEQGERK